MIDTAEILDLRKCSKAKKLKLFEHQEMIVDHVLATKVAMVIAGMGLGKTSATLTVISELIQTGEIKAALIVSPLRVTNLTWGNEAKKWEDFSWLVIANLRTAEGMRHWRNKSADIYLINYDLLQKFSLENLDGEHDLPVDMVVWDEISKAKNPSSKRINAFRPHRHKFKRHVGLTGTPISNGYADIFAQIRLLDGGLRLGHAFGKFRSKYFQGDYMGYKYVPKAGAPEAIQQTISDMTVTLRSEDWLDIPPTEVVDHEIILPKQVVKQYKQIVKELLLQLERGEIEAVNAAALTGKLLQITGGAVYDVDKIWHELHDEKIKELKALRKDLAKQNKNLLVICHYRHELERIKREFPEALKFSEDLLDAWNRGEIPMMVSNAASIGHGLNLQEGAHHLAWFTLTYSRELYDQTNARLARTGQTEKTYVHRLICRDTIDEAVVETLRDKGDTQNGLISALKNLQTMNNTDK